MYNVIDPIIKLMSESVQQNLTSLTIWSMLLRIFLAIVLGGAIGFDRALKRHAAGLRTYILISLASALAMMVNQFVMETFSTYDMSEIGAMAILGVSFLGSGTIMVTSRNQIKGLTTAAGLWASAMMGLAIGAGAYTLSIVVCVVIIVSLSFLPKMEDKFRAKSEYFDVHIEIIERSKLTEFMDFCREAKVKICSVEHNPAYLNTGLYVYTVGLAFENGCQFKNHEDFISVLKKFEYMHYIEEINV